MITLDNVIDPSNFNDIFKEKIWEILGKNLAAVLSHPGGTKITMQRGASALSLSASYLDKKNLISGQNEFQIETFNFNIKEEYYFIIYYSN